MVKVARIETEEVSETIYAMDRAPNPTLVDQIARTVWESEYCTPWPEALTNKALAPLVERQRRIARLAIEATAQYLEAQPYDGDPDSAAAEWVAGFLRDAGRVPA